MTDSSGDPNRSVSQIIIAVRLTARAGRNAIVGWDTELRERLLVRVAAPAVDDRANQALIGVLAGSLQIAKRDVTLLRGQRSRIKLIGLKMDTDAYERWASTVSIIGKERDDEHSRL